VENRFQSLPFKCNLQRYNAASSALVACEVPPPPEARGGGGVAGGEAKRTRVMVSAVGLHKQVESSLPTAPESAAWFLNPCTYKVISWFEAFAFTFNLYRYAADSTWLGSAR
jgi:hypothetical protein